MRATPGGRWSMSHRPRSGYGADALADARSKLAAWRDEYNGERPHGSLGYRTPNEFAETLKSSVMTG
jgi:transposase InsO family protein